MRQFGIEIGKKTDKRKLLEKRKTRRERDTVQTVLIGVSSLPLTECRQGGGPEQPADPSAFTGLPDNKDWCLGGMLQTPFVECLRSLNAAFPNVYLLIKRCLALQLLDATTLLPGLKSTRKLIPPSLFNLALPICLNGGKIQPEQTLFLMLVRRSPVASVLGK